MAKIQIFENDQIEHIKNDLEKIRIKSGMYIGYSGWRACNHLGRELIQNSIDECMNPKSPGSKIEIIYDENLKILRVIDDGRGIPIDSLVLAACSLNSGSKFTREQSGASAGENGVGVKAVAALSETFTMTSLNNGNNMTIKFVEGELVNEEVIPSLGDHGLICEFKPSVIALGKDPWLDWDDLVQWIKSMAYLIGDTKKKPIVFTLRNGTNAATITSSPFEKIVDMVSTEKRTTPIVSLKDSLNVDEIYFGKKISRKLKLEIVFGYTMADTQIVSFANFVSTIDHGSHVDGVKESISRYFSKLTLESLSDREKKTIGEIRWSDVMDGLILIINLSTDHSLGFASQSKSKISNEIIFTIVKGMTMKMISEWLEKNPNLRKVFTERIKLNARARITMTNTKEHLFKPIDRYEESRIPHYMRCTDDKSLDKEIFLIEGDSAMNAASAVRNPKNQALFGMIGVPANGLKKNDETIFKNERFDSLVKILGCGKPKTFKLENLKFSKIIMLSDADVDGIYIKSLFSGFFMTYFPDIVRAGRLYAAVPPLYRIKIGEGKKRSKDDDLVTDRMDYIERFNKSVTKKYRVSIDGRTLSSEELKEFLYDTRWYLHDLMSASEMFKSNRKLVELVWMLGGTNGIDTSKMMKTIQEEFEHLKYEPSTKIIYGVVDGKYQSLTLGNLLFSKGNDHCMPCMKKYKTMYVDVYVDGSSHHMTIGEFLALISPEKPKIITRFKGLGEFEDRTDLRYTTIDPNTRSLLQLQIGDYENDISILGILHGNSEQERLLRKEKVHNYVIDPDQIDN